MMRVRLIAAGLVVWTGVVFLAWTVGLLLLPLDPDYTAGELLDHVVQWRESGILYSPLETAPYRVLNYPPAFLVLVRGLVELGASPAAAGRLLNTLAVLLLARVVFRDFRARGSSLGEAAVLTALLGTSFPVLYAAGQFHLETLAVALTAAGFVTMGGIPRHGPGARRGSAALAGALLALACLVKQSQVPLTLAVLLWNWRQRSRGAARLTVAYGLVGAVGCLAILAVFGGEAWRHMLTYSVGTYSLGNLGKQLLSHAVPWVGFGALGVWLGVRGGGDRSDPRWWYFAASGVWSLSAVREGSGYPYFLDWHVATLLWTGPWLARQVRELALARRRPGWVAGVLGVQMAGGTLGVAAVLGYHLATVRRTASELPALCAAVAPAPALTAAEPGIARVCGGRPAFHPFIVSSLIRRGLWHPAPLVGDLQAGRYASVVLPFNPDGGPRGVDAERWGDVLVEAMREGYTTSGQVGRWWVLEPARRAAERREAMGRGVGR